MPGAGQDHRSPDGDGGASGGVAVHHGGAVTDARVVAAEICADLRGGDMLDPAFDRRTARLDARDRRWVRELVYGTLRRRARLDSYLDARIRGGMVRLDADLLDLLRLGASQLLFMESVPAYAAIAQTVELAKRRHGTAVMYGDAACSSVPTGRTMVLTRPWHTS